MRFGETIVTGFAKSFQYSGRATRSEFWRFFQIIFLTYLAIQILALILFSVWGPQSAYGWSDWPKSDAIGSVAGALFIVSGGALARRLNDAGHNGNWVLALMLWQLIVVVLGTTETLWPAPFPYQDYLPGPLRALYVVLLVGYLPAWVFALVRATDDPLTSSAGHPVPATSEEFS